MSGAQRLKAPEAARPGFMSAPRRPLVHAKPRVLDGFQWGAKRGLDPQETATGSSSGRFRTGTLEPATRGVRLCIWTAVVRCA
jgi:hypothetical protein